MIDDAATSSPPDVATIRVGGVPILVTTPETALDWMIRPIDGPERRIGTAVRLVNAYSIALTRSAADYRRLLGGPGANLPDGAPVAWYMRARRRAARTTRRVRGPSLFVTALDQGRIAGTRHFLLGGSDETMRALVAEVGRRYPGVQLVGTYSPSFRALDDAYLDECRQQVLAAVPDVVWVGLGTPKQDFVVADLAGVVPATCVGIGAAFDFVAGTVREAPPWIQRSGFEWAFRLVTEPRRLWRRYLVGNLVFLWAVIREFRRV